MYSHIHEYAVQQPRCINIISVELPLTKDPPVLQSCLCVSLNARIWWTTRPNLRRVAHKEARKCGKVKVVKCQSVFCITHVFSSGNFMQTARRLLPLKEKCCLCELQYLMAQPSGCMEKSKKKKQPKNKCQALMGNSVYATERMVMGISYIL